MKIIFSLFLLFFNFNFNFAQTQKVAILDFENTSGKPEYDALAKAISNMLITDLANNIHPKKVEFFERSQLNKLLDEQKLQKSKNFDTKTAVDFGKLSGVNNVFVGSIFVLDGNCNISSKLIDVQTSKILLAKEVNGTIVNFLQLKSQLSYAIALQLNNPIILDPSYKDQTTSLSMINQYGKILATMDQGNMDKAEEMRSLFEETNPDFKYYKDLKNNIEEMRKQIKKNTEDIDVLNKSGGRVVNAQSLNELMNNITNPLTPYSDRQNLMMGVLKFETQEIAALTGQFSSICNMPAGMELLVAPNEQKALELYNNDLAFITKLMDDPSPNKRTFSYYAYYYLRMAWTHKYKSIIPKVIEVCEKLNTYNLNNAIEPYDVMTFAAGGYAFSFNRKNDLNLSVEHLIELLKKEQ